MSDEFAQMSESQDEWQCFLCSNEMAGYQTPFMVDDKTLCSLRCAAIYRNEVVASRKPLKADDGEQSAKIATKNDQAPVK